MKSLSNANLFDEYLYNEPFTSTGNHDYKIALIFIYDNLWIEQSTYNIKKKQKIGIYIVQSKSSSSRGKGWHLDG